MPKYLYVVLLVLSLIWGGSFFFIKILLETYNPMEIAFFRSILGLIFLWTIMLVLRKPVSFLKLPWPMLFFVGITNSALPWSLIAYGETHISSSLASIVNATTPIWTILVGVTIFRIKLNWHQWLGVAIGFIGILILLDIDWTDFAIQDIAGVGAILLATLSYGVSSQFSKRYLNDLSVYQVSFGVLCSGILGSFIYLLFTGLPDFASLLDLKNAFAYIGLGGFGSGIAYILFYLLIQKGSAEFATLVTYLVPPSAMIWGVVLLKESIATSSIFGLLLIFAGIFISGYKKRGEKPRLAEGTLKAD